MADNTTLKDANGNTFVSASDDISGVLYQRVKQAFGVDGSAVDVSASNPLPVAASAAVLTTGTDRSGSITAGGTAQQLAASNTARVGLKGQNIDASADLWINEIGGTAAASTAGSFKVPAGAAFSISTTRAISIVGATTGQKFTATEF